MSELVLTSDFPSTANQTVIDFMKRTGPRPRIAWIPPETQAGRQRYPEARRLFESYGLPDVDYCDIDEEPDDGQLEGLTQYDIIYLSGGDPIRFRRSIRHVELGPRLERCLASGCMVAGASGGSLQLTKNVSLFRLSAQPFDEVVADYAAYGALGFVPFEVLPHVNRLEPGFLELVRRYSERVPHDIIALRDGDALFCGKTGAIDASRSTNPIVRFRAGVLDTLA